MLNKKRFSSNHVFTGMASDSTSLASQTISNLHWYVSVLIFEFVKQEIIVKGIIVF